MINKTLLLACIPVLLACGSDSPTPPLQPTITVPTLPPSTDDTDDADDDEQKDNSNITFTEAQLKFPKKKELVIHYETLLKTEITLQICPKLKRSM